MTYRLTSASRLSKIESVRSAVLFSSLLLSASFVTPTCGQETGVFEPFIPPEPLIAPAAAGIPDAPLGTPVPLVTPVSMSPPVLAPPPAQTWIPTSATLQPSPPSLDVEHPKFHAPTFAMAATSRDIHHVGVGADMVMSASDRPPASEGSPDPDALFDARHAHVLWTRDEYIGLTIQGYRHDKETQQIRTPRTGHPLTNRAAYEMKAAYVASRRRTVYLRLYHGKMDAPSRKALLKHNEDIFHPDVLAVLRETTDQEAIRAVIRPHLEELAKNWLRKAPAEPPTIVEPFNAENEERLGLILTDAIVDELSADPEGASLLAKLKGHRPKTRVLHLDALRRAVFAPLGRQMIIGASAGVYSRNRASRNFRVRHCRRCTNSWSCV